MTWRAPLAGSQAEPATKPTVRHRVLCGDLQAFEAALEQEGEAPPAPVCGAVRDHRGEVALLDPLAVREVRDQQPRWAGGLDLRGVGALEVDGDSGAAGVAAGDAERAGVEIGALEQRDRFSRGPGLK